MELEDLCFGSPPVYDFDIDGHETVCGVTDASQLLRTRQGVIGASWGDDPECKAAVLVLRRQRVVADRGIARAAWVAANPTAYAAEQAALAAAKAAKNY